MKYLFVKDFTKYGFCWEGDDTPPDSGGGSGNNNPPTPEPPKKDETVEARAKAAEQEAERLRQQLDAEKRKAETLQKEKDDREKKRLEDEGNWKELANKESERAARAQQEKEQIQKEADERIINTELKAGLALAGVEDPDYALFVDKSKIRIENGRVVGLDEALKELKDKKPHIFTKRLISTTSSVHNPPPTAITDEPPLKDVRKLSDEEYRDRKRNFMAGLKRGAA